MSVMDRPLPGEHLNPKDKPDNETMVIYNVTINIEESVHHHWLQWMKTEYIPAMLATGKFSKALMSRISIEEEMGGMSYSIQYTTDSKETLQKYYEENARQLQTLLKPFQGKYVSFCTELEVIGEAHNELFKPTTNPGKGGRNISNEEK